MRQGAAGAARRGGAGAGATAVALGYEAAWSLLRHLPERAAYRLGDAAADRVTARGGRGPDRLRANLRRALPAGPADADGQASLDAAVRAGMRSYVRYWVDAFRLPGWDRARIVDSVRTVGRTDVAAALGAGRGVVAALGHLGNWDHAGAWSCLELARVTTVAERLRPERLYDRFVAFREALGMEILPLTGGPPVMPVLAERLAAGGFVPLLADRDLTGRGVEVDLLGEPALVASGPAVLAARTGAALHPITITYERRPDLGSGWGLAIEFHPEVPVGNGGLAAVAAATQACADAWTRAVRAHPEDWHMLQRVFRADLDGRRSGAPSEAHAPQRGPDGAGPPPSSSPSSSP